MVVRPPAKYRRPTDER